LGYLEALSRQAKGRRKRGKIMKSLQTLNMRELSVWHKAKIGKKVCYF